MSTDPNAANSMENSKPTHELPAVPQSEIVEEQPRVFETEKEAKAEWLKPWCFKPGQSGNPSGRPRKQPITQALEFAADLPCPPHQKKNLEKILGVQLPHSLTLAQAAAIGQHIKAVTNTHTAAWIADRIDGPMTGKMEIAGLGGAPLLIPNLTVQFVEVNAEGKAIRTLDLEAPQHISPPPAEPKPAEGDGSSDAATKLSSSDSE